MNDSEQKPTESIESPDSIDLPVTPEEPTSAVAVAAPEAEVEPEAETTAIDPEALAEIEPAVELEASAPVEEATAVVDAPVEVASSEAVVNEEVLPEEAAPEEVAPVEAAPVEVAAETEEAAALEPFALDETALLATEAPTESIEATEPEAEAESTELSLDEDEAEVIDVPGEVEAPKKEVVPVVPIDWQSATESILLAADKTVSVERLREIFGEESPSAEEIEQILLRIAERHEGMQSGITLRKSLGGWQFATRAENSRFVQRFLATKPFRLGRSALETLSIVAYRQPVTRAEIDQVRGIDSSHLLRVLMERGLVRMAGKADLPGRPVQYGTTPKFLETVGLPSLADLPPLSELDQLKGDTPDPIKELEAGLDRFIQEAPTPRDISLQATDGLPEIDALIEKAEEAPKEVYGSQEAAEVAKANEEALLAHQDSTKKVRSARRKKTITFDELTGGAPTAEEATEETDGEPTLEADAPSEEEAPVAVEAEAVVTEELPEMTAPAPDSDGPPPDAAL